MLEHQRFAVFRFDLDDQPCGLPVVDEERQSGKLAFTPLDGGLIGLPDVDERPLPGLLRRNVREEADAKRGHQSGADVLVEPLAILDLQPLRDCDDLGPFLLRFAAAHDD